MATSTTPTESWKDSFRLGIRGIDDDHFILVSLTGDLYHAGTDGNNRLAVEQILVSLVSYVKIHFAREERLMRSHQYPDYESHKAMHDGFARKVIECQDDLQQGRSDISAEMLQYLKDWIGRHIAGSDKKLATYLKERGVS